MYWNQGKGSRGKLAVGRSKQKIVSRMKNSFAKPKRGEDLVLAVCANAYFTAEACMLTDQHWRFAGCDLDSAVLSAAEPEILLRFALQMLNPDSDIRRDKEMRAVAQKSRE